MAISDVLIAGTVIVLMDGGGFDRSTFSGGVDVAGNLGDLGLEIGDVEFGAVEQAVAVVGDARGGVPVQ